MASAAAGTPRPKRIAARRSQGILEIDWDDGHQSRYRLADLRAACPCAECRTGDSSRSETSPQDPLAIPVLPARSNELAKLEPVGNYALQMIWKDGHRFGIYPWDYLRRLCPCEDHRAGRVT